MRVALVAGARPQFIKAAALLPALRDRHDTRLVHTGQHADPAMVEAHFAGLGLPPPDTWFKVAGGPREQRRTVMRALLDEEFATERPDRVVVVGDTDSTLAGAEAAHAAGIPVAHVEAGARSGEPDLPEESIRIAVDELADLRFCATPGHAANLAGQSGVHVVGDVMADVLMRHRPEIEGFRPDGDYAILTLHRAATADDPDAVRRVLEAVAASAPLPVVFPKHPRTRPETIPDGIDLREPMPYLDFLAHVLGARFVLTDSGGLQKEALLLRVPCITLRDRTEWAETVDSGWNVLVGTDPGRIAQAIAAPPRGDDSAAPYGDGHAAERIADLL
jgi:UDP-N-acetylglucosamine 2-epimerase